MNIIAVITILLLLFCYVGQRTQPAVTEAHCCFLPSPSLRWNLFWPGDFSRSLLERCLESVFFFPLQPPSPLWVYIYFIFFSTAVTWGIMLSVYLAILFSWMRHSTDAWWEFHYTCHKCPFGLKDELIRILWSEAQGRRNLTNTLLNTQLLVTCQILSF